MNRKHLAALGTSIALVAALTACSSGDADEPTTENEKTESTDTEAEEEGGLSNESAEDTTEEDSSDDSSASVGSSDVDFVVGGESVVLDNPKVQCAATGDTFAIAVTADNMNEADGDAFGALMSTGDDPVVSSVALSQSSGMSVAYTEGLGGSADVTVDGKTYTITGEGLGVDLSNPTSTDNIEFSFTVTCP